MISHRAGILNALSQKELEYHAKAGVICERSKMQFMTLQECNCFGRAALAELNRRNETKKES